mgnify:CR=1 FL=1
MGIAQWLYRGMIKVELINKDIKKIKKYCKGKNG